MATLQSSRQVSAYTAKTRLKQVTGREHPPNPSTPHADSVKPVPVANSLVEAIEFVSTAFPPVPDPLRVEPKPHGLSERDLQSLLLQVVTLYQNWRLISVVHKPEGDLIIAHLLRNGDRTDPAVAMREGRTMQVIMDATGNMKVQYARRRATSWKNWLYRLTATFARVR